MVTEANPQAATPPVQGVVPAQANTKIEADAEAAQPDETSDGSSSDQDEAVVAPADEPEPTSGDTAAIAGESDVEAMREQLLQALAAQKAQAEELDALKQRVIMAEDELKVRGRHGPPAAVCTHSRADRAQACLAPALRVPVCRLNRAMTRGWLARGRCRSETQRRPRTAPRALDA